MRIFIFSLLLTGSLLYLPVQAQQADGKKIENVTSGGQPSLRGLIELDVTNPADAFKREIDDSSPYVSDYVYQPPLIPHSIRNYELSINANKCLSCHSFRKAPETGATKISVTHYETREGQALSDVSPRRYFCLQCHVAQTDSRALVENNFKPVESLR